MAVINGAHSIIYSKNADADREFLKDVLGLPSVDVGRGWLIFALPPAELAVHPGDDNDRHELYLMVKDHRRFLELMQKRGVICTPPRDLGWGVLIQLTLPGGGKLGVYEPRHARPKWPAKRKRSSSPAPKARTRPVVRRRK